MRKIPDREMTALIEAGYESRRIEFKPPFSWEQEDTAWLREKVIQTILGLSNTRDGGDVIVGIEQNRENKIEIVGMTDPQIDSFDFDRVKGNVDRFASPAARFDIAMGTYADKNFVVIRVGEFEEFPVICKDTSNEGKTLRTGDVYTRSRSGPPATIRATESEMREILELAVDKSRARLEKRGWIRLGTKAEELFRVQRGGF